MQDRDAGIPQTAHRVKAAATKETIFAVPTVSPVYDSCGANQTTVRQNDSFRIPCASRSKKDCSSLVLKNFRKIRTGFTLPDTGGKRSCILFRLFLDREEYRTCGWVQRVLARIAIRK